MGLNYHKSVKVNDNTKVNINKKSASVTVGTKGVHHTVSTSGRNTTTVGIPGTGLSYSMSSSSKSSSKKKTAAQKKKDKTVKMVISAICSVVAAVFIIIGLCKYFGVFGSGDSSTSSKSGMSWRKDEYNVAVGKSVSIILDFKKMDDMSNAKASDFEISVDNEAAVSVEFKQAYSETVHFSVTGIESGAATVKVTYKNKTTDGVTINVTE